MAKPTFDDVNTAIQELQERRGGSFRSRPIFYKLLTDFYDDYETVLDIGSGGGKHAEIFRHFGKEVLTCDMSERHNPDYLGNFLDISKQIPDSHFDCVWCSHVLEHTQNPGELLKELKRILKENGLLAITVPPMKHNIVCGHVGFWTAGLLLYNLVHVGFDCSEAIVREPPKHMYLANAKTGNNEFGDQNYDVSVLVKKRDICWTDEKIEELNENYPWPDTTVHNGVLCMSGRGMRNLMQFLPKQIKWIPKGKLGDVQFDGRVGNLG